MNDIANNTKAQTLAYLMFNIGVSYMDELDNDDEGSPDYQAYQIADHILKQIDESVLKYI